MGGGIAPQSAPGRVSSDPSPWCSPTAASIAAAYDLAFFGLIKRGIGVGEDHAQSASSKSSLPTLQDSDISSTGGSEA